MLLLEVVNVDDRRVSIVPAMAQVRAYNPATVAAWYFSAKECEAVRTQLDLASDGKLIAAAAVVPPTGGC